MWWRCRNRVAGARYVVLAAGMCALVFWACSRGEEAEVEVEVRNVGMDHMSQSPVVVLQDKEHRVGLPIWIGPNEAQAIAMQIEGVKPPRPMTHDLMKTVLDEVGVDFDRVVIGSLKESTYYAKIHLHSGRHGLEIDSRPSDAIALAVRFKRPIFVAKRLLRAESTIDLRRAVGTDSVNVRGLTVQAVSAELAEYFDLPAGRGVLVSGVDVGVQGVHRGDVVVKINGAEVAGLTDFSEKIEALGSDEAVLIVQRGDARIEVALAAPNE